MVNIITKYVYYKMFLDLRTISIRLIEVMTNKIQSQKSIMKFHLFDREKDANALLNIYNRAFLVNPDPFQSMNEDDLKDLTDRVIIMVKYLGRDVGFIWFTIDENNDKKMATVSIIAVLPEKQRRGVATALAVYSYEYLKSNNIYHLGCIVGEKNKDIQNFVKFIGFKKFGEEILEY
ncbi:MAG: GNAT family N-acetyltransferase [Candidatus Lokiarchaeota archaeon]|nr:GNAT family N-acetyltransferase [Candidatus Lokiarchaeota archaeon]